MSYSLGLQCQNDKKAIDSLHFLFDSKILKSNSLLSYFHNHWSTSNDGLPYIEEKNVIGFNSSNYIHGADMSIIYSFFYMLANKLDISVDIKDKSYIVVCFDETKIILGDTNPNIVGYDFIKIDEDNIALNYTPGVFSFVKKYMLKKKVDKIKNAMDEINI